MCSWRSSTARRRSRLLKTFNAERYASLSIAMGQTNEIIAQVGRLMKSGVGRRWPATPCAASTLMGTSASSATVRNYSRRHAELRMPDGGPIFDGFLLTSTLGNTPLPIVDVPMVQMPTQTEVHDVGGGRAIGYRRPDSDAPGNRFRLYEVAGMPHNNSRENPGFLNDPCTLPVTDFPAGAFTALGLELSRRVDRERQDAAARAADRGRSEHRRRRLVPGARRARQREGRRPERLRGRADASERRDREGQDARAGSTVPAGRHRRCRCQRRR